MYAVFGIPLFFSYLSKNGDMMATLFRMAYARGCKPVFRMISRRRRRKAELARNGALLCSMQSFTSLANLETNALKRLKREATITNNSTTSVSSSNATNGKVLPLKRHHSNLSAKDANCKQSEKQGFYPDKNHDKLKLTDIKSFKRSMSCKSILHEKRIETAPDSISLDENGLATQPVDTVAVQYKKLASDVSSMNFKKQKLIVQQTPVLVNTANGAEGRRFQQVNVPISLTLCMMSIYILIGAVVFCMWENPDYVKWSYFCFVTLSTIGFGDIVPGKF